jgi:hypothetical protein
MALNDSKWSKIYQHFPFKGAPNFKQIEIFGKKINHLATLGGECWHGSGKEVGSDCGSNKYAKKILIVQ